MLEGAPIGYWIVFHAAVVILIAGDLVVLNRRKNEARIKTQFAFVVCLLTFAAACGGWIAHANGRQAGLEFASSYLIELSLSIDNLFVFLLVFRSLGLGLAEQRKVLLLGVAGAIVMRGVFILSGIALLNRFEWIQIVFGVVLLVAAVRLLRPRKSTSAPGQWAAKLTQRWGKTPKMAFLSVVIAIELIDLVFALDSVPAVLAVSHSPIVVYSSNICAILGLRSVYFLLANLLERLRFLHLGLAAILGFVAFKMLSSRWIEIPIAVSLGVIVLVVLTAIATSLFFPAQPRESTPALR